MTKVEKEEFQKLYHKAHEPLQRFCIAKSYGIMDAKDLAGETILVALESFSKIKNKKAFLGFLFGIANNVLRNNLRKQKFSGTISETELLSKTSNEIASDTKLDIKYLYDALRKLPDKQHDALILFEISGYSIKEICEIQNSKESAVKQRLKRGREKLAFLLNKKVIANESISIKANALILMFFLKEIYYG